MGVSIKCLFVLALCSQILPSQQACPDNCHVEDGRLVTVKCVDNGGTADCACQTSSDDPANTVADCASVTSETFGSKSFGYIPRCIPTIWFICHAIGPNP